MSLTVNVQEAKTRLSELLRRVEAGEEVTIARAGTPIAKIQAAVPPRRSLERSLLPEIPPISGDALFESLSESELADWENGHASDPLRGDLSA